MVGDPFNREQSHILPARESMGFPEGEHGLPVREG
jgi:hypothetical protein